MIQASPSRPTAPRGKSVWRRAWKQRWLWIFALPGIVFFCVFSYAPMVGVLMAFQNYDPLAGFFRSPFIGMQNFIRIFKMPSFMSALRNTFAISLLKLLIGFPAGIIFALMINELRAIKVKRVVQTVTYLPYFISWVIAAGIWYKFLTIDHGIINDFLMALGVVEKPVFFMGDPKYFYTIVVLSALWKDLGFGAIIYLATLAGINPELYEAAEVDGAGRLRRIWHISLPGMSGIITLMLILSASSLMSAGFDQMWTMGNLNNREVSEILDTLVLRTLTQGGFYGYSYGTAMGLFQASIGLLLFLICNYGARRLTGESLI